MLEFSKFGFRLSICQTRPRFASVVMSWLRRFMGEQWHWSPSTRDARRASSFIVHLSSFIVLHCSSIILLAGCNRDSTPAPASPATGPATLQAIPFAPITYFNDNCSRCHGPYGSFFGPRPTHTLAELRQLVKRMADGPGNAPIAGLSLDAEAAYQRSLADHHPFIAVTQSDGTHLKGEITPGSTLALLVNGQSIPATVTEHTWTATLPANVPPAAVELRATLAGQTTTLRPTQSPFSHGEM